MLHYYHVYCKYFLIKHKPWHGNVNNAWGGPIPDPNTNEDEDEELLLLEDDNNSIVNRCYVDPFFSLPKTTEITAL